MLRRMIYALPLLALGILVFFLYQALYLKPSELPSALINKPLPAFALGTVEDIDVIRTQLDIHGPALLNVWGTWCPSCRVEHPFLQTLSQEGVSIYGVNYKDNLSAAKDWLSNMGNPYLFTVFDSGKLGLDLGVYGAPETFIIDKHGLIRFRHAGILTQDQWNKNLKGIYEGL